MKNTTVDIFSRFPIFAERFSELRGDATQKVFAEKLGISIPTVGFYENGERLPNAAMLARICRICGVSADWLLGLTGDPHPQADAAAELGLSLTAVNTLRFLAAKEKALGPAAESGDEADAGAMLALLDILVRRLPPEAAATYRDMRETERVLRRTPQDRSAAAEAQKRLDAARETAARYGTALLSGAHAREYYRRAVGDAVAAALGDAARADEGP